VDEDISNYKKAKFLAWEHALVCTYGEDQSRWPTTFNIQDLVEFFIGGYLYAVEGLAEELLAKARWDKERGIYEKVDR